MNAVEIEEAISDLAREPFDPVEFPFAFLEAFGNKATTIKRLRSGATNNSDIDGVLQRGNIHIKVSPESAATTTLTALKASPGVGMRKGLKRPSHGIFVRFFAQRPRPHNPSTDVANKVTYMLTMFPARAGMNRGTPRAEEASHTGENKMTDEQRIAFQERLISDGSALAELGHCGESSLPCGACDECLSQANICQSCIDSIEGVSGDLDPDYCKATETVVIDGIKVAMCVQCAECVNENGGPGGRKGQVVT